MLSKTQFLKFKPPTPQQKKNSLPCRANFQMFTDFKKKKSFPEDFLHLLRWIEKWRFDLMQLSKNFPLKKQENTIFANTLCKFLPSRIRVHFCKQYNSDVRGEWIFQTILHCFRNFFSFFFRFFRMVGSSLFDTCS